MNVSSSIPRSSLWRGKSPTLTDLGTLLDYVSEPALILERTHQFILFANSSFLTFSAYASSDLIGRSIQTLFQEAFQPNFHPDEEIDQKLLRKHRPVLDVKVSIHP